jgi:hypothetical protein
LKAGCFVDIAPSGFKPPERKLLKHHHLASSFIASLYLSSIIRRSSSTLTFSLPLLTTRVSVFILGDTGFNLPFSGLQVRRLRLGHFTDL